MQHVTIVDTDKMSNISLEIIAVVKDMRSFCSNSNISFIMISFHFP